MKSWKTPKKVSKPGEKWFFKIMNNLRNNQVHLDVRICILTENWKKTPTSVETP